jgi:hypothetical protein
MHKVLAADRSEVYTVEIRCAWGTAMAKDKSKPKADRHLGGFVVRLPERYRKPIKVLCEKNRRSIVGEITLALDAYLKAEGYVDPDDE